MVRNGLALSWAFVVLSVAGDMALEDRNSGGVRGLATQNEGMVFRLYGTTTAE